MSANRALLIPTVLLGSWAVYEFVAGQVENGVWTSLFVAVCWLPSAFRLARIRRAGGVDPGRSVESMRLTAGVIAVGALALGLAQLTGIGLPPNTWKGLLGVAGFLCFAYVALRLPKDSGVDDGKPHHLMRL